MSGMPRGPGESAQGKVGREGGCLSRVSGTGMPRQEVPESEEREAHYFMLKWVNLIKPLLTAELAHVSRSMLHE